VDRLPIDHRAVVAEARALYLGEQEMPSEDFAMRAPPYAEQVVAQINELARAELRPNR
jgi:hypothetical protein